MSEIYSTGTKGEKTLAKYLEDRGHDVQKSDIKTFDLIVDGRYVEVKSSKASYSKLGFIGLTDNQFKALNEGVDFSLFLVCNLADLDNIEIIEIEARKLLSESSKVECTYYWYRPQLDKIRHPTDGA